MDFFKNNKVILTFLLVSSAFLGFFELNNTHTIFNQENVNYSFCALKFPLDFFGCLKTNCLAPLYHYYLKIYSLFFNNFPNLHKFSNLILNLISIIVMYFIGKNYQTKDPQASNTIGLICAGICAFSSFLIYFCLEAGLYSLVFLLSSLILLYSIKMYEAPSKHNFSMLTTFSILLILTHTIGFVFVLFNAFALIAFHKASPKGKKKEIGYMPIVAGLVLSLPLIPFLFRMFAHPTYISQWWSPFNWSNVLFLFSDFFSPILKNITNNPVNFYNQLISNNQINFGFFLFAFVPSLIMIIMSVKSIIEAKRINKYFFCVFLSTFLTVLISAIAGKLAFLTKYYTELYPLLILMTVLGFENSNPKNSKVAFLTVYFFMNLFFIIAVRLMNFQLLG